MEVVIAANQVLIKKENLDPNQYTASLLREGLRIGIIRKQELHSIQMQIMLLLKDLILRYTNGISTSVKIETAEKLLASIYYSLDAYTRSFSQPEDSLALLRSKSIKEIYEEGLALVIACFAEAKAFYSEVLKNKLDVPLEIYNVTVKEAFPGFFQNYSMVFHAYDNICTWDYPLIFDDKSIQGVYYIKNYLETLDTETLFCRLFSKEDIAKTLENYGRIYRVDYIEAPLNLFEILINNSIFSALLGNNASNLYISKLQFDILEGKLEGIDASALPSLFGRAVDKLIKDLGIVQPKLIDYIHKYYTIFAPRVLNALRNHSLHNVIITCAKENHYYDNKVLLKGSRMSNEHFRRVVRSILDCENTEDKLKIIEAHIQSLEDFIDVLRSDCLFGDEFAALFAALGNMELAVLGRTVFSDDLRDGLLNLFSIDSSCMEAEWHMEYIKFLQGLDKDRIKSIEELINEIRGE